MKNARYDRDEFSDRFCRFLSDDRHIALVYDRGGVLGFLSARTEETLRREGLCAEILDICVNPACRSAGIGGMLLAEAERLLWEQGSTVIEVSSGTARADAHRFYEKHGYVTDHRNFRKYSAPAGEKRTDQ